MSKAKKNSARGSPPKGRPPNDPGIAWRGNALRLLRLREGCTRAELGTSINTPGSSIARWERHPYVPDNGAPPAEAIPWLCTFFGCRPAAFTREPKTATERAWLRQAGGYEVEL